VDVVFFQQGLGLEVAVDIELNILCRPFCPGLEKYKTPTIEMTGVLYGTT
jgi:hypothetical protein